MRNLSFCFSFKPIPDDGTELSVVSHARHLVWLPDSALQTHHNLTSVASNWKLSMYISKITIQGF